ncbi:DAO domain-containing protein [Mycena indigotica]|uniref:DAO domain-containing protein n=1 Tax=Mycena indigotica TaxID=2126181 RepID=A0A8H6WFU8_9AGAR|nr:DAO domain-containing protein [Mycena indigotica]KAF7315136.1 DAO domain-containing protein [Mycena indigotica]
MSHRKTVIVGSGCFGLSTALHLLKRGWEDITVIDKAPTLPAPDGASNDFNRIVRTSYSDPFYAALAQEAIQEWRIADEWGDTYHESAVLVLGSPSGYEYTRESYKNDSAMGLRVDSLDTLAAVQSVFPANVPVGNFAGLTGYLNRDSGWANAGQGVSILISKITELKGNVISGKRVVDVLHADSSLKASGVRCDDGTILEADLVVLATGSWTGSAFPQYTIGNLYRATGQSVAMVQLTPEEGIIYQDIPVVLDFETGFYIFPPNDKHIVKMAIHAAGYTHSLGDQNISTPRTILSNPDGGLRIPSEKVRDLRAGLHSVYSELAKRPFISTRLCWYNDTVDGDWVIGYHPDSENTVLLATGGSGHAYKFLPVIGRLVADAIEGKLDPPVAEKFSLTRKPVQTDESRHDNVQELDLNSLCTPEDLANLY